MLTPLINIDKWSLKSGCLAHWKSWKSPWMSFSAPSGNPVVWLCIW